MIVDGRMPTPEEAEAQLRQRLAAEEPDADDLRVDSIAAQLEKAEQPVGTLGTKSIKQGVSHLAKKERHNA
jgi:hypothetical protein